MSAVTGWLKAMDVQSSMDYEYEVAQMLTQQSARLEDHWLVDAAYCIDATEYIPAGSHKCYGRDHIEPTFAKRPCA
jgi:hypothetical protein